jgi:hypothetical protein
VKRGTLLLVLAAAGLAPAGAAHEHRAPDKARDPKAIWEKSLARPALAISVAFDARGRLWRARVENGQLWVSRSDDAGRSFAPPVAVNRTVERVAADGESRPKLAFGPDGELYVSWTQNLEKPFSGHVRFSRSLDDGHSFSTPLTVNDNAEIIGHRFDSLLVDGRGGVWLMWLDKRDASAAKQHGEPYTGAALYYTVSQDRGARFALNHRLAEHSCECCRIALAREAAGVPVVLWRHVFEKNIRDHALARLDGRPVVRRASHEQWAVDACPHHGPALAIGHDGVYHLAWYSGAEARRGLFYTASRDRGASFSAPLAFGNPDAQAAHPQVLSLGARVVLAWKEFDGREASVRAQISADGGRTWGAPRTLAVSAGASDHPQLASDGRRVYLSWNSAVEGHRMLEIPEGAP